MWPFILAIIVFLVFSTYMITQARNDILYIIINLAILWVVLLRSYFEIRHKRILYPYLIALGITTLISLLWFDYIQIPKVFWTVGFLIIMFALAELVQFLEHLYKKYDLGKKLFKKK